MNVPKNIIACRPQSYCDFQKEAFALMADAGIKYAEVPALAECDWQGQIDEMKKHGITPTSVAGGVDFSNRMALTIFSHTIRCGNEMGVKKMFLSVKSGGTKLSECYRKLRDMGDIAKAHGITVVLETHPDLVTNGDEAAKTMKAVNHPNIRLNYDTANLYYYNKKVDGVKELKKFLPWLGAVHLKASCGKLKTWWFPGLGEEGDVVKYAELFKVLKQAKFYGPYTLEIEGIQGEKLSRETAIARVKNSMAFLKKLGVA
jgi:L-ribulose-5-phosphate 3-epimerase